MKTDEMEVIDCNSLKEEPPSDVNNDLQKVERIKSLELLKKKMCRSHDLIQYYNDKKKECEQLTISLRKARTEANEMKNNYNTTLSKLIKQELQNTEQRKTIESYITKISELETKIAGDQRLIEQLNCKIDSIEDKSSGKLMDTELKFEEKIKTLELEVKKLKKGPAKRTLGINTEKVKVVEIGTNVRLDSKILQEPIKKIVTNASRKTTKQNSTFLCEKCDIALNNLVKTFKVPEPMIQPFPPENKQLKFKSSESFAKLEEKKIESKLKNEVPVPLKPDVENQAKQEESETLKILSKTLKTLEQVIKSNKKSEKKAQCCYSNSCSSNSGNQDLMLQIWKKLLDRDEQSSSVRKRQSRKKLKRCQNMHESVTKKKKKKKTKTKNTTNWSIESTIIDSEASTSNDNFKIPQIFDRSKIVTSKKSKKRKKVSETEFFTCQGENFENNHNSGNIDNSTKILRETTENQFISQEFPQTFTHTKEKILNTEKKLISSQENESIFIPYLSIDNNENAKIQEKNLQKKNNSKSKEKLSFTENSTQQIESVIQSKLNETNEMEENGTQNLQFSSNEKLENIKTSTPRKNKLRSEKNLQAEEPCRKISKRLLENKNVIVAEISGKIGENLENVIQIEQEVKISERRIETEENKIENSCQGIEIIIESTENREMTKTEMENLEKMEISLNGEIDTKKSQEFSNFEISQESDNFKGFHNSQEEENSKNFESSMENFIGFHNSDKDINSKNIENLKEFEILQEFENFEKCKNLPESEKIVNLPKQLENEARKIGEENSDEEKKMEISKEKLNLEGKMEKFENGEKMQIASPKEKINKFDDREKIKENLENSLNSKEEMKNLEKEFEDRENIKNLEIKSTNSEGKILDSINKFENEEKLPNLEEKSINSMEKIENSGKEFKNGENSTNSEEKIENSGKEFENRENSTNSEGKIEKLKEENKYDEHQNSEKKSTNPMEKIKISYKELEDSKKLITKNEEIISNNEIKSIGKNSSGNDTLPEELLSAIDVLGEISFSDESILDCNASFLSFSQEKSRENPEKLEKIENEGELELQQSETKLNPNKSELVQNGSELDQNGSELVQNGSELDQNGSELIQIESELDQNESELIEKELKSVEKMEEANIFLSNSEVAKIPRNSIHGNRSTEMRLTLISPKRRGRKRKTADDSSNGNPMKTTRTSLMTKMRTMKKRSSEMIVTTTTLKKIDNKKKTIACSKSDSNTEDNFTLTCKKRRIAHTPKIDDEQSPIEVPIRKSLRSASKSPGAGRNSLSLQTDNLKINSLITKNLENSPKTRNNSNAKRENCTRNLRNSKNSKIEEIANTNSNIVEVVPVARKRGRPRKEIKSDQIVGENSAEMNFPNQNQTLGDENRLEMNISDRNQLEANLSINQNSMVKNSPKVNLANENVNSVNESSSIKKIKNKIPRNSDNLQSSLLSDAKNNDENVNNDSESETTLMIVTDDFIKNDDDEEDVINDSWKIARAALKNVEKFDENSTNTNSGCDFQSCSINNEKTRKIHHQNLQRDFKSLNLSFTNPMFEHMNRPFSMTAKKGKASQESLEKRILLQLNRLTDSKDWTSEIHFQVIEEIWKLDDIKTTAKCIVDFLTKKIKENEDEPMDTTHTPPAPMMTRTQQKIITLISTLEEKCKELENVSIFELIFDGINFSLFRLGLAPDNCIVEGLSRIFTCMARLKKDRERARLFIIDALYCYRFKANVAIFVVLTCWSEVFPNYDANIEILPKCMAFIIYSTKGCYEALKKLLTNKDLYNYPLSEIFPDQLAIECLSALEKNHETSVDTAIILLSKCMGPKWTQKMIIQGESGLKQLIVGKRHKSPYDAFTLLGNVMRSFPEEDTDGHISQIVEQLCDLLDSDEGSDDHLEGVASALLCFSKYRKFFCKVAKSLIPWTPKREIRDETKQKFQYFCNSQSKNWWYEFIKSNYTIALPEIQKNTKKKVIQGQKIIPKINKMRKRTKNIRKKEAKVAGKNNSITSQ